MALNDPSPTVNSASSQAKPAEKITVLWAKLKRSLFSSRRRQILTLLVSVPLFLCAGYWLIGLVAFADTAKLTQLKGVVQHQPANQARWAPAQLNQLLWRKDRLRTGSESTAQLLFFDVSSVALEENTEVSIVQVAKRRGGSAIDVVLKTWAGKVAVRAVRFVDPSSTFQIDTPTASTVARGARFSVQVAEDGTTRIEMEEGKAEVKMADTTMSLTMGQRITMKPDGYYEVDQMFEPDPKLVYDKLNTAWYAPGSNWQIDLTETEVNQFLTAQSRQPDFPFKDTQVWFLDDEVRVATTVVKPALFDLSGAMSAKVENGQIKPTIKQFAAGVAIPLPEAVLSPVVNQIMSQMDEYLAQAYQYIDYDRIEIKTGHLIVTGSKKADAPVTP